MILLATAPALSLMHSRPFARSATLFATVVRSFHHLSDVNQDCKQIWGRVRHLCETSGKAPCTASIAIQTKEGDATDATLGRNLLFTRSTWPLRISLAICHSAHSVYRPSVLASLLDETRSFDQVPLLQQLAAPLAQTRRTSKDSDFDANELPSAASSLYQRVSAFSHTATKLPRILPLRQRSTKRDLALPACI